MQVFLVGGAVRDELLKLPVTERDWVVVGASPDDMLKQGFKPVGRDFPVFLHPQTNEEYALARTERKQGQGYHGFSFNTATSVTLEEDLARRDLTINAIAKSAGGEITDPYGGLQDLKNKILRHVSPAFIEDPVRVLRVARFAARFHHLGFTVASETMEFMSLMVKSGEVAHLVAERVWKELERALGEKSPQIFIQVLRDCGALAVIFPEINRLFGVPQPEKHHPEIDTGIHLLLALQQITLLTTSLRARYCVLVHDLGKGLTPEAEWPRHIAHEERGVKLIQQLGDRLRVPRELTELGVLISRYHTNCHRALELRPETILKLLTALDVFRRPDRLEDFLFACEADARGRLGLEQRDYPQAPYLREACKLAREVDVKCLMEQGLVGEKLGAALTQQRVSAIRLGLTNYLADK